MFSYVFIEGVFITLKWGHQGGFLIGKVERVSELGVGK